MKKSGTTKRWWDLIAALVLVMTIMSAAARLYSTQWTTDLDRIQILTLIGIVLGLALGQSSFSSRVVRLFALCYGLFFVPWQLALMQSNSIAWGERLISLWGRIEVASNQFYQSQGVEDSVLFIALMAVLFFILGLSSGYYLTRHGYVWASIIPAGVAIFIINHYDIYNPSWGRTIGTFLFFSLLLIGRMAYLRHRAEWQESGVSQTPETHLDIGRASVVAVIIIILLAWNVPALAASSNAAYQMWDSITQPWHSVRDRLSDAVASLQGSVALVSDFYGDTLSLGTGTRLGDDLVFTVETTGTQPRGVKYYWRARSYDLYRDGDWENSSTENVIIEPSTEGLTYPQWQGRRVIQFTINSRINQLQTLYTGSLPLWVSRPGQAVLSRLPDGAVDVTMLLADPPLYAGETYRVRSWISAPTITQLRNSTTEYPDWVNERYLDFPEYLSDRIPELSQQITAGLDNPYDKTMAITQYLRDTIEYATTVPNPPDGIDPIEWFLFDLKRGYCNYYATAQVLMLRSIGIPARLVAGFAEGELQEGSNLYFVRHREAHAWPEVYFEGYGWVEFEPTVSQAPREFLLGGDSTTGDLGERDLPGRQSIHMLDDELFERDFETERERLFSQVGGQRNVAIITFFIGLGAFGLVFMGWRTVRQRYHLPAFPILLERSLDQRGLQIPSWLRNWSRRAILTPLEKAYGTLNLALKLLGSPAGQSDTPAERADRMSQLLPTAEEPARILQQEYEVDTYSPHSGDTKRAREASTRLGRLTFKALLSRIFLDPKKPGV
jgi:transglutaminase-like putative cysteine protease